jgi:signal transduction histidine kinase
VAGRLAGSATAFGWSSLRTPAAGGEGGERLRVLTASLPNGYRLIVGDDRERVDSLERTVVSSFAWAFVAIVVMGGLGGWALSHAIGARLAAMTAVAEGIMEGDLARRIPVTGADDDLERLAATFNQMLERIAALMESLRQVSTDIAHDLRTPLSRLRQRLEASAGDQAGETIAAALADVDALLDTFAALLRIAQIEGGGRRSAFQAVDLAEIAAAVVEAFAPSAEDAGQALALTAPGPAPMVGDRELLVQLIANLIENALRHAGPSAKVEIAVSALPGGGARLVVADDGPGVPKSEGDRIFDRFYRLERSRSTEGSGLGLALVAAVARLHGAALALADAEPGLRVSIAFPPR